MNEIFVAQKRNFHSRRFSRAPEPHYGEPHYGSFPVGGSTKFKQKPLSAPNNWRIISVLLLLVALLLVAVWFFWPSFATILPWH